MARPVSRHGHRDAHRKDGEWPREDDLVFSAANGAVMSPNNLRMRVLKPAAEEACVSWVGFHALRRTCATMLFAQGRNAVQVQRWFGHTRRHSR
jgi:integrase